MATDVRPLKVSTWLVPGTTCAAAARRPMRAAPMTSESVPNAFETRTRTSVPPRLVWTIWRKVWLLKVGGVAGGTKPGSPSKGG
jgi:hypothetical protein